MKREIAVRRSRIRNGGTLDEMRNCQRMEWDYARALLQRPLRESFQIEIVKGFSWEPDSYGHIGKRGDIINKNVGKATR